MAAPSRSVGPRPIARKVGRAAEPPWPEAGVSADPGDGRFSNPIPAVKLQTAATNVRCRGSSRRRIDAQHQDVGLPFVPPFCRPRLFASFTLSPAKPNISADAVDLIDEVRSAHAEVRLPSGQVGVLSSRNQERRPREALCASLDA
jgi:hypothetical protein